MIQTAINELRKQLTAVASTEKAPQMAAYMKNQFSFLGVSATPRNEVICTWKVSTKDLDFWELIFALWEEEEREFQYGGIDLLKKKKFSSFQPEDIQHIRTLISSKSWWDTVDLIAAYTLGGYLKKYPEKTHEVVEDFVESGNMWLQRSALIFQLKYGAKTDFELLKSLIHQFLDRKEFFIQKAIGWALRQHSKIDPVAVKEFVATIKLSTVAKREAYKYL